jgi:hypothetical protein
MNSYVSELGAPTQPAGAFFRTTDVVAGVLIVVLAVALRGSLPRDWRRDAGATALGLAGASSVFDGWHPIACAPSTDPACRLREDTMGLLGQLREPHTASSVAGVTAAIASMVVLGHLLGSEPGSRRAFGLFGQVAASVVTGLSLAEIPLTTADPGVGLIERSTCCASPPGSSRWLCCSSATWTARAGSAAREGPADRRYRRGR